MSGHSYEWLAVLKIEMINRLCFICTSDISMDQKLPSH